MKILPSPLLIFSLAAALFLSGCNKSQAHEGQEGEAHHEKHHKIVVTSPVAQNVVSTQRYVAQIHSRRHIEVRALDTGYLGAIRIQEGQAVKQGEVMFNMMPVLYQANLDTELAEAELAQIKYENTKLLSQKDIVSTQELALARAELSKANAKVSRAQAELNFTSLRAPFDGIIDRQHAQQGSLVEEGDILSTLSDNQVMWVYFNVPEARYLEYKAELDEAAEPLNVELELANGKVFPYPGKIGAIEADFNNETGNIAFRADFQNPDSLLRHGQTGSILLHQTLPNAIVIPQRATFEILAKKYAYVVEPNAGGKAQSGVVHPREIVIQEEMDDLFVIKEGLEPSDKIIFEGQVRDGDQVEYEFRPLKDILKNLKFHAE